jgi:hypothetical protein
MRTSTARLLSASLLGVFLGFASLTAVKAGTTPGSYTITVTGTSNSITSTGTVILTVQ